MVQKFCDEPCDEVPHGSRLRPTDFLLRPTEKKFHWSRRGIVTNGIFVVTNEIFAATNRIFLVNVATLQRELYASSAEVFSFTGWYLASPKARSPHTIHIFIYNATGGSNLLIR
jgi:hypothetical protein